MTVALHCKLACVGSMTVAGNLLDALKGNAAQDGILQT